MSTQQPTNTAEHNHDEPQVSHFSAVYLQGAKEGQRQGGALTIKHTAARKGKGPAGGAKAGPPGSDLERKVVNCLCCGKVYDFRLAGAGQLTNDLLRFLGESCCHMTAAADVTDEVFTSPWKQEAGPSPMNICVIPHSFHIRQLHLAVAYAFVDPHRSFTPHAP